MNNLWEVSTTSGSAQALTKGSNLTFAHNYHTDNEMWNSAWDGVNGSRWMNNISQRLAGTGVVGVTGVTVSGNLTGGADLSPFGASNVLLAPTDIASLFISSAVGNYLPSASSPMIGHQSAPVESYDIFYNLRDSTQDYPGPISKKQISAPVWPF